MIGELEKQVVDMLYPTTDALSNRSVSKLNWYADLAPYPLIDSSNDGIDPVSRKDARLVDEFHCKMFDMTKKEDVELYSIVKQRIISGWYTLCKELVKWEENPLLIWLEWVQSYKELY